MKLSFSHYCETTAAYNTAKVVTALMKSNTQLLIKYFTDRVLLYVLLKN